MKLLLTLAISLWLGVAAGAVVESARAVFWFGWFFVFTLLLIATLFYIRKSNTESYNARNL